MSRGSPTSPSDDRPAHSFWFEIEARVAGIPVAYAEGVGVVTDEPGLELFVYDVAGVPRRLPPEDAALIEERLCRTHWEDIIECRRAYRAARRSYFREISI